MKNPTGPAWPVAIALAASLALLLPAAVRAQTMTAAATSPAGASGGTRSCGETTGPTSCGASGPASKSDKAVADGGGNPINVITGNKYQREVDLPALPGVLGLELVRHYNSQFSGVGFPNGIMGRGWKLSYETELHVVGRALQIVQADGARMIFSRDLLDPSHCGTSRPSDGRIAIRRGPQGDEYVWTWPDGRRLSFDHRGKLVQIAVPTGEFVTLQHDAGGHLVQVTDPQGRQLKLNYGEPARRRGQPARFTGVQSIDTPVGRYVYEYGSVAPKGTQVDKIQLVANLVKVHLPTHYEADKPAHPLTSRGTTSSSVSRTYHYEDVRFPTLLTGISVSGSGSDGQAINQRISTYGYDQRGWAVLSEHGGLKVELAVLGRASLSELPGSTPGRSVLVHGRTAERPEGRRLEIRSAMVAGDYRITETRGEPCVAALPCPRANMRYRYDAKGRLIEEIQLDPQGQPLLGVRTAYDPMDRVLRVSQILYKAGKAGVERWMVRYEYGATGEQPTLIARPSVVPGQEHQWRVHYNAHGQAVDITETAWRPAFSDQPAAPIQRTVQHAYRMINGRSVLVSTDGPLPGPADTTRYEWDARGDFIQALGYPLGLTQAYRRDNTGRVTVQTPPDQVAITLTYLPTGEPQSWQRGPAVAKAQYDALQRPTRLELPDGEVRRLAYTDQAGVAMASNAGWARWLSLPPALDVRAAEPEYPPPLVDSSLHPPVQADVPRQPWPDAQAVVDDFGRLIAIHTSVTGWDIRRYDEAGQLLERRLDDDTVWRWQRDALGRIQWHEVSRPGSATQRTQLRYEGVHLISIEHPQQSERYTYDAMGRVQAHAVVRSGLSYTERYEYDQADRMTAWRLPEGGSLRYSWGVGRQIKAIAQDDGRASAVLGERLSGWLGLGQHRIIDPLAADGPAKPAIVPTPPNSGADTLPAPLQQALQAERGYRWGNGVALHWHLNGQGQLAHMRWELPEQRSGREWLGDWMTAWLPQARAQTNVANATTASNMAQPAQLAANVLLQTDFGYDALGRMQERSVREGPFAKGGTSERVGFAYDQRGRLLVVQPAKDANQRGAAQPEYYAYDDQGRLQMARWEGRDHDWRGQDVQRDVTGLPQRITGVPEQPERTLTYDADRRLVKVRQAHALLAHYTHDTHGLRIAKSVFNTDGQTKQRTQYLWQGMKLVAETVPVAMAHDQGATETMTKLARRYVYAHGVPVALIDYAGGAELRHDDGGIGGWFVAMWRWISTEAAELRFVHANEIGTPVAVTDEAARVIWRVRPTAYGLFMAKNGAQTGHTPKGFTFNLRLPGQYFDAETGWHDNVLRTYDPHRGEYLEPDPLGPVPNWRSGQVLTQPYAYANHDPLTHADPSGLILFAFDGTGNTNDEQWLNANDSSLSNVWQFRQLYQDGNRRYVSGVGTVHQDQQYGNIVPRDYAKGTLLGVIPRVTYEEADMGGNYSGPARIERMLQYFNDEAELAEDDVAMDVDIVGFSRGAAQSRDFANRIVASTLNGYYSYKIMVGGQQQTRCQKVNFRFMGLFDTVLSTNRSDHTYALRIPENFTYVAQAMALNEYRGETLRRLPHSTGAFPLESIMQSTSSLAVGEGKTRIELGFIGAHADIGGGFGATESDLARVALNWMVQQAKTAGVKMAEPRNDIIANPAIHDKSDNQYCTSGPGCPLPNGEDRRVNYGNGTSTTQRQMVLPKGMNHSDTGQFIRYLPAEWDAEGKVMRMPGNNNVTGTVHMKRYLEWLRGHGYDLGNLQVQ
jgi:RHS repeat-associated protein